MAYRIVAWRRAHENYDTEKRVDGLAWIGSPTSHDSAGLKRLMREPDGAALYGAYQLMAQVSAKLPKVARGWLVDRTGRALDAQDLADKTGPPIDVFARALQVLTDPDKRICWLE